MCVCVCVCVLVAQSHLTLQPHGLSPARLLCPWYSPGKNTGVDCHTLLQRIFPIQGSNPGLLHCRQILYCLSYREIPNSPWNSLGQNTGVGSLSLLQGIFPIQGSNPGLLHRRRTLHCLSSQESPNEGPAPAPCINTFADHVNHHIC